MIVAKKLEYAVQSILSIARHDDATVELREAALQHIVATVVAETIALQARHAAKTAAEVAALTPPERA